MAGRIPQSFIDDLLERLDIVEVIDRRVKLKRSGKNYSARCPFHEEKTPSFSVNPDKQFYYCFGCGAGGNALGFVMDYENLDFPQAVESLAQTQGLEVPREQSRGGPAAVEQNHKALYDLMEQVARYYQTQLRQHPSAARAVDYLKQRGLTGQIAKQFDLGFAAPGWDNLLQQFGSNETQRKLLLDAGMLVQNESGKIYDRFRDRIVFPIRDQRGRVIAFGGRVLGDDKPKYLNSPETAIFHKGRELYGLYQARKANRKLERILVVEGYMDVIALAQHDISYATATLGTATSKTHLERIFRLCPEVVFCFDGDQAGRKAAFRALEAALPALEDGRQARFLFLPEGEDPDDAVRAGGRDGFELMLQQAKALENFLFETLSEGLDSNSLDGRARLSKLALPYIRQMPEGVYQQLMFQELARRTGLELSSLMQLEAPAAPKTIETPVAPTAEQSGSSQVAPRQREVPLRVPRGHSNLAQAALALLLHKPEAARLVDSTSLEGLAGDDISLLAELLALLKRRPESSTAMLLGHWYGTPEGELLNRLAGQERLIPSAGIEQQLLDTMQALAVLPQKTALEAQVDKLKSTNYADMSASDKQLLIELLQKQQKMNAKRGKRGD
ncbi:DNA primase [Parahaliea sp. F7430]|uniref:DNA primase n=1 Tax=Sediminihaliea albiluteola TaxID=2758564 RepID=A0A7W2TY14_9GAMM|nr:DNA primase [Sediminihaliea albiluteola]MBA6414046.1 DNA primase [Sediminihaliea albiluteola]